MPDVGGVCPKASHTHTRIHITTHKHTYVQRQLFVCWLKGRSCVFSFFCLKVLLLLSIVVLWAFGMWLRVMRIWQINSWFAPLSPPSLLPLLCCPLLAIAIKVVEGRQLVKLFGAGKQSTAADSRYQIADSPAQLLSRSKLKPSPPSSLPTSTCCPHTHWACEAF